MVSLSSKKSTASTSHLREYVVFMALVPILIGYFSVISDNLYSFADAHTGFSADVWMLLAVLLNDFATWLLVATFVGWRYGGSLVGAIVRATLFAVISIILYLLLTPMLYPGNSVSEGIGGVMVWVLLAGVGGIVGGATGYLAPKWPVGLVFLVMLATFRMMEMQSWGSWLGISRNLLCLGIDLAICGYWVISVDHWVRRRAFLRGVE